MKAHVLFPLCISLPLVIASIFLPAQTDSVQSDLIAAESSGHCVRTVHAEANAIVQAARNGVRIDGAAVYVTASPCWGCFRLVANAGIGRVCFGEFYRDPRIFQVATRLGIELVDLSGTRPGNA